MKEYVLKQKQDIVNEIKEAYENSQSVVLVEYRGLDVAEITELDQATEMQILTTKYIKIQ